GPDSPSEVPDAPGHARSLGGLGEEGAAEALGELLEGFLRLLLDLGRERLLLPQLAQQLGAVGVEILVETLLEAGEAREREVVEQALGAGHDENGLLLPRDGHV